MSLLQKYTLKYAGNQFLLKRNDSSFFPFLSLVHYITSSYEYVLNWANSERVYLSVKDARGGSGQEQQTLEPTTTNEPPSLLLSPSDS